LTIIYVPKGRWVTKTPVSSLTFEWLTIAETALRRQAEKAPEQQSRSGAFDFVEVIREVSSRLPCSPN
jgi:hypothetical protein